MNAPPKPPQNEFGSSFEEVYTRSAQDRRGCFTSAALLRLCHCNKASSVFNAVPHSLLMQAYWCEVLEESVFEGRMKAAWYFGVVFVT